MKKITLLSLLAIATLGISSCTKDWTCQCTDSNGTTSSSTINGTKSQATSTCNAASTSTSTCTIQ